MNGISARVASSVPEVGAEVRGASVVTQASFDGGVGERLVVGAGDAEQALVRPVEGGLEVGLARDEHQDEHDREADRGRGTGTTSGSARSRPCPSATSADVRMIVTIETNRMPFSDAKKRQAVGRLDERRQRLEELDVEDRAVDRRPQREDEPPAGGGQDEPDAAASAGR